MRSSTSVAYHRGLSDSTNIPLRSIGALGALAGSVTVALYCLTPLSNILDRAILRDAAPSTLGSNAGGPGDAIIWTPGFVAAGHLLTGALIPASMAIEWAIYGRRTWGSICSTAGEFRWELLWAQAKRIVPACVLFGAAMHFWKPPGWPVAGLRPVAITVAVLLTTPIQAAAEEFIVRGLLTRLSSSWFANTDTAFWASTAVANVLFAAMHMSSSPINNAYYVIAGVCGTMITHWTGGLEATSLLHATSNMVLLLPISASNNISLLNDYTNGEDPGWLTLLPMANVLSVAWLIRRMVGSKAKQHRK